MRVVLKIKFLQSYTNRRRIRRYKKYIKKGKVIPESNLLWRKLEESVIDSSREFKYRLNLLTGGKIKTQDYHVALLIKCGISPTNISILIGRAKGTVSYRREALCEKSLAKNMELKL